MMLVVLAFDLYGVSGFEGEQLVRSAPLESLNDCRREALAPALSGGSP